MKHDFAVFIISAARAGNVQTIETLQEHGYTGDWYVLIDREEDIEPYTDEYGENKVVYFDKNEIADDVDRADNLNRRDVNVYARNKVFQIAEDMGYRWFAQFDDDYHKFETRWNADGEFGHFDIVDLDDLFDAMIDYMKNAKLNSVATAQGGDFIGGKRASIANGQDDITASRKVMNTFICDTERMFEFVGTINEDVNTYIRKAQLGKLFLTPNFVSVEQERTQQQDGGLTDAYLDWGTYVKSFYTILYSPSSVTLNKMGESNQRIHHRVDWNASIPKIVPESVKKD